MSNATIDSIHVPVSCDSHISNLTLLCDVVEERATYSVNMWADVQVTNSTGQTYYTSVNGTYTFSGAYNLVQRNNVTANYNFTS